MHWYDELKLLETRREFLGRSAKGIGTLAFASLLNIGKFSGAAYADGTWQGVVDPLHHAPKAKRVIHLCMAGGPSHLETFDHKPILAEQDGKSMPASITQGQPIAQLQGKALRCLGPQHGFQKYGESRQEVSDVLPKIGGIADDICIVRSMVTEQINHDPAHTFMNTGSSISGRPSMGSWFTYGLGTGAENLPGFVVLTSIGGGQDQPISTRQWSSGFLPSKFQGVQFSSKGDPVHYVNTPSGVTHEQQGDVINAINKLNAARQDMVNDPEIATRISQYEMAFKMQTSVPDLIDFSDEPQHIKDLYGAERADGTYAANCLLARRLAERGVRFIQLYHRGWDHHGEVKKAISNVAGLVDQATAALITDLKQRGMLDDTLVIWGGEFGRTPMAQGSGRDHHIKGFSLWMAGGGIKPGMTYGATDDFGYNAVEDIFPVHDLHATMLHLFGVDHKKLTFRAQGRDYRLTDVHGHVRHDILS
ncbi:MAG: DUF1501 domain-containing protein [Candidatus Hydrogenedentota bacterium]